MSRSGSYDDGRSRTVLKHIHALGSHIDLLRGDITVVDDVRRVLGDTRYPVGGIIQGAVVLLDRPFSSMTIPEFHGAYSCKVQGTWNLHNVSLEKHLILEILVMGGKVHANYVAANSFLDSFSLYRYSLGLTAHSVNLGLVEDVRFVVDHDDIPKRHDDYGVEDSIDPESELGVDPWLRGLVALEDKFSKGGPGRDGSDDAKELKVVLRSGNKESATAELMVSVASAWLYKTLILNDVVEPERPLSVYRLDSRATVEFRNSVRSEFGVVLSSVDITKARSLTQLAEGIMVRAGTAVA